MRDLKEYSKKCMDLLDYANIPYVNPKKWRSSKRMTRCYGMFMPGKDEIAISERLLDERVPEKILENTIIHELIHTNENCRNHGKYFHEYGNQVRELLGYNITTYVSEDAQNKVDEIYKPKKRPYIVYCPSCKMEFAYAIKGNVWKNPHRYMCNKCRQRLERKVS